MKNVTVLAYIATSVLGAALLTIPLIGKKKTPPLPKDNPLAAYRLNWVDDLPWQKTVDIKKCDGQSATERLADAQKRLGPGGGVIYFPSGIYRFQDDVVLKDGIILRGVAPTELNATHEQYYPQARFEFPRYTPRFTGTGAPTQEAFKVIRLENPETAKNTGILNIAVNHGRIVLREGPGHRAGRNRFVVGCALTNAAGVDSRIPDPKLGQQSWQRFPDRSAAAIEVYAQENALIANNRIPEGASDDFLMDHYVLQGRNGQPQAVNGVAFDYSSRPGIKLVMTEKSGEDAASFEEGRNPSVEENSKGAVIRNNFIFSTTRDAVLINGKRVAPPGNTLRIQPDAGRLTEDGLHAASATSAR